MVLLLDPVYIFIISNSDARPMEVINNVYCVLGSTPRESAKLCP